MRPKSVRRSAAALTVAFVLCVARARAQDATLAPADESFGRFNLSVLAIANSIRDAGARFDDGTADAHALIAGPLAFATDAIHAWETRYPQDPWIPKDLLALEAAYLKFPGDESLRLASATEAWIVADYPASPAAARARQLLDAAPPAVARTANTPSDAWERFAALRAPLPPPR